MAKCISCGSPTVAPGICTDCATSKWYVAILYYSLLFAFVIFIATRIILTVDNLFDGKTVKEFGMGQYFRNIGHIHDESWIGEITNESGLYAYDAFENPTDSFLISPGIYYEDWGYRKINDSTTAVCAKLYSGIDSSTNWYIRVPEHWGWFMMQFSPKSDYLKHDVSRSLRKTLIEAYYSDPRVEGLVVAVEGKKEIKRYKANEDYKKLKAQRSFDIFQRFLVPIVESVLMPSKKRADFVLKENQKELKKIQKEYFDKDLLVEKFLVQSY